MNMQGTPSNAHGIFLLSAKYISISVTISVQKLELKCSSFTTINKILANNKTVYPGVVFVSLE